MNSHSFTHVNAHWLHNISKRTIRIIVGAAILRLAYPFPYVIYPVA